MLDLTREQIKKVAISHKKKLKHSEPTVERRIIQSPQGIVDYYNSPNRCLNCNEIISAGRETDFTILKSRNFCSKSCEELFLLTTDKEEAYRRASIVYAYRAITDALYGDEFGMNDTINRFRSALIRYKRAMQDKRLEF